VIAAEHPMSVHDDLIQEYEKKTAVGLLPLPWPDPTQMDEI
jgi:hypothetical protein